jgi:hypothetical protein
VIRQRHLSLVSIQLQNPCLGIMTNELLQFRHDLSAILILQTLFLSNCGNDQDIPVEIRLVADSQSPAMVAAQRVVLLVGNSVPEW